MDKKWVARLFEAPLEEFVQARNALVRELRGKGTDDDAKAVAALRKPSKALWLVNDVARREPAHVKALVQATARVRKAQEKGASGDELREAMREQREALNALTAAAGDASVERRVHDTLQAAAMTDPDALREARIEEELQPSGFDAVLGLQIAPRAHPGAKSGPPHEGAQRGRAHGTTHATTAGGGAAAAKREAAAKKEREQQVRLARKEAERLAAHAKKLEEAAERAEREAVNAEKAAADARHAAHEAREKATAAAAEASAARASE